MNQEIYKFVRYLPVYDLFMCINFSRKIRFQYY